MTQGGNGVTLSVARNFNDIAQVWALRAATFAREQDCPYEEEFDGNDFCSLHILARQGSEPLGAMRMRFFADFTKWERLCVSPRARGMGVARAIVEKGFEISSKKGYCTIYGHSTAEMLSMWRGFGFTTTSRPAFSFSDYGYCEIVARIPRHPKAISLDSRPLDIIRPEGEWDAPGVLDRSNDRLQAASLRSA
jgi:predicted GNAT family N-acyltransferase